MELLHRYVNGNYAVELYDDGTKIRQTDDNYFEAHFPENIDIKITNYCDANCAFCHENSTVHGNHGNLNAAFLNTLRPGTELAIGGGNPLSHPDLVDFLERLRRQGIICNLTVNQLHVERDADYIRELINGGLIKGLGISFMRYSDSVVEFAKSYRHTVIHVINGVVAYRDLMELSGHGLKLLILGYKYLRRGETYYSERVEMRKREIYDNIHSIIGGFDVVSFDNLGIEQLNVRRLFTSEDWDAFYMGDDGQFTMYVDVVENEFALSSTSLDRHLITGNIDEMFAIVKSESRIKEAV